jgi:chromate transport protein ChrA
MAAYFLRLGALGFGGPVAQANYIRRAILLHYAANPYLKGFVRGITVAVIGVLVGTTYLVGKTAIGDVLTVCIAIRSLLAFFVWNRLPEPAVASVRVP